MTQDQLLQQLATQARIPALVSASAEALLADDLGIDSIQTFELMVLIEAIAGSIIPPDELPTFSAVSDLYRYFEACRLATID